jgi:hypothetical protein
METGSVAVINPENFTVLLAISGVCVHTTCSVTGTDVERPVHELAVLLVVVFVMVLVETPFVGGVPLETVQPVDVVLVLVTSLLELPASVSGGVKVTFPVR